ncbi:MAG: hypothetical protein M0R17_06010 [Candidatus Omnitrophica bacterium]|jgi:hypothetical protein|nr:hypothetical protein [Candidatus Omnitrophota bacterium]
MNKKGMSAGALVMMAIGIIVALAFLPAIFSSQAQVTNTYFIRNGTVTLGAVGTYVDLPYQEFEGTLIFSNATGDATAYPVNVANFTIVESVSPTTNEKRVRLTPVATSAYGGAVVNYSGTFGLVGYADDAGSRGVAGMIGLMAGLAVLAIGIAYFVKEGGLDFIG